MNKNSIYDYLGWIAVVAVPIAPVFFFAHKIYNVALTMAGSFWLSLSVGVISAIGLEIVGIYAGHTAMEFWRRGDNTRAAISGAIMLAYVANVYLANMKTRQVETQHSCTTKLCQPFLWHYIC